MDNLTVDSVTVDGILRDRSRLIQTLPFQVFLNHVSKPKVCCCAMEIAETALVQLRNVRIIDCILKKHGKGI
jgi:hypothetical protein